ncbi:glycosyltransferase, partial [Candidatus Pelagibacter bacterium]|nr:glycosyltransferase [Candidatus Pelagibacter bacterium]
MKITTLIISYKSLEKLENCINSIGFNKKIIVIENSNNKKIKEIIEKKYINVKVILNNSNLGYAKASNIGFELIETEYAFL